MTMCLVWDQSFPFPTSSDLEALQFIKRDESQSLSVGISFVHGCEMIFRFIAVAFLLLLIAVCVAPGDKYYYTSVMLEDQRLFFTNVRYFFPEI